MRFQDSADDEGGFDDGLGDVLVVVLAFARVLGLCGDDEDILSADEVAAELLRSTLVEA